MYIRKGCILCDFLLNYIMKKTLLQGMKWQYERKSHLTFPFLRKNKDIVTRNNVRKHDEHRWNRVVNRRFRFYSY